MNVNELIVARDCGNVIEYNYTEGLSLLKPIWYFGKTANFMTYNNNIYRDRKGYPKLNIHFQSNDLTLRGHYCKDYTYIVGGGMLFLVDGVSHIPLVFTCLNENEELVLVVNTRIRSIKPLKSFIKKNIEEFKGDLIWTNEVEPYCFREFPKVKFKNFIDQRNYYQHIADEWIKANSVPIKIEEPRKREELPF